MCYCLICWFDFLEILVMKSKLDKASFKSRKNEWVLSHFHRQLLDSTIYLVFQHIDSRFLTMAMGITWIELEMCELYGRVALGWNSKATTFILCELKTTTRLKLGQVSSWSPLLAGEASFLLQRWECQSPSAPRQWGWQRWAGRFRGVRICLHTCVHRVKSLLAEFKPSEDQIEYEANKRSQGNGLNKWLTWRVPGWREELANHLRHTSHHCSLPHPWRSKKL